MSNRLSGEWFKLVSQRGDDLGVLMVPDHVADYVDRYKSMTLHVTPSMSVVSYDPNAPIKTLENLRQYHIARGNYPREDAIFVVGISPEKLSLEPGFAFLPSAHYMRQLLMEEPAPPPNPAKDAYAAQLASEYDA